MDACFTTLPQRKFFPPRSRLAGGLLVKRAERGKAYHVMQEQGIAAGHGMGEGGVITGHLCRRVGECA